MHMVKVMEETDWELLLKQKYKLVDMLMNKEFSKTEEGEAIRGIINWMDDIQDAVVAEDIKTEEEVFGKQCCGNCSKVEEE